MVSDRVFFAWAIVVVVLGALFLSKLQPFTVDNVDAGASIRADEKSASFWFKGKNAKMKGEPDEKQP